MSAETDFRAALVAYSGLTALVGTRVAQNAIEPEQPLPYVVFTAAHGADPVLLADAIDTVQFTCECWAKTGLEAQAVAAQVRAAIAAKEAATASLAAWVSAEVGGFDSELGLDAQVLTVEWVAQ